MAVWKVGRVAPGSSARSSTAGCSGTPTRPSRAMANTQTSLDIGPSGPR
jgi:hypothetical protein